MECPDDERLLDKATSVARRFACYGGYGSRRKALAALARRAPGFEPGEYATALDLCVRLYEVANPAIKDNVIVDKGPSDYAEFEDIDFEAALAELDKSHRDSR